MLMRHFGAFHVFHFDGFVLLLKMSIEFYFTIFFLFLVFLSAVRMKKPRTILCRIASNRPMWSRLEFTEPYVYSRCFGTLLLISFLFIKNFSSILIKFEKTRKRNLISALIVTKVQGPLKCNFLANRHSIMNHANEYRLCNREERRERKKKWRFGWIQLGKMVDSSVFTLLKSP